jgi:SAM-dependent methyltransferase
MANLGLLARFRKYIERSSFVRRLMQQDAANTLLAWREFIARVYLKGDGIEIGALNRPLKVPGAARVKYLDRMSVADLRAHYAEMASENLVEPDIIDDGERLSVIPDNSQDFVIANHFLEHCQDPIGAILNMLRALKQDGILYLAVPDKRYSPDVNRPVTSNDHLLRDHREGATWSKRSHFEEFVRLWTYETARTDEEVEQRVNHLMELDFSIHYHVWTMQAFMGFLSVLGEELSRRWNLRFEVELLFRNEVEILAILRKRVGSA